MDRVFSMVQQIISVVCVHNTLSAGFIGILVRI